MRLTKYMLGLLSGGCAALLLLSGRGMPKEADEGLAPGEQLPSIVVDGKQLSDQWASEDAVIVVWSVNDATSRVVQAWLSNRLQEENDITLYSICVDATREEANYYTTLDNAHVRNIWGLQSSKYNNRDAFRLLSNKGKAMVYYTTNGIIQSKTSSDLLWEEILRYNRTHPANYLLNVG